MVFQLRRLGAWLGRDEVLNSASAKGILAFRRVSMNVRQRYGNRAMVATLLDAKTVSSSVIRDLHWARVVQIKEGGVMIEGTELHHRGLKSGPERWQQTCWCVVDHEPALAALERMRAPGFQSGFHPNDD